ncbi:hypothetical protein BHE74_00043550 [Ensete ventricosum]|nr:hypothetical protein GW17_00040429 [Ensete ventricosum]RWW50208.1 hypothetical protein BHE74_00043550 [Ensete ventricosum]RZS06083.1 hypothetical protein BHM03_00036680 [Ensete ventricosum]
MLVGDRGPGSRQWGTNSSEVRGLQELLGDDCPRAMLRPGVTQEWFSHSLKGARQVRGQGQVVERGEEATTSPEGLSYPKSKVSVRKEVDSEERHSAAEANLLIVKEGTQM